VLEINKFYRFAQIWNTLRWFSCQPVEQNCRCIVRCSYRSEWTCSFYVSPRLTFCGRKKLHNGSLSAGRKIKLEIFFIKVTAEQSTHWKRMLVNRTYRSRISKPCVLFWPSCLVMQWISSFFHVISCLVVNLLIEVLKMNLETLMLILTRRSIWAAW
jgi:hypothetical protein